MEFESKFKEFKVLIEQDLLVRKVTTLKAFLGKTDVTFIEEAMSPDEEKKQL
jgi:hypothetical protein